MDDSLTIGVRHEPGYVIITAAGEIDVFTVARLHEQLFTLAGHGRPLIADLDQVTFLGAAGLGALAGGGGAGPHSGGRPPPPPPAGPACTWYAPGRRPGTCSS
jgi:hypothetical protein